MDPARRVKLGPERPSGAVEGSPPLRPGALRGVCLILGANAGPGFDPPQAETAFDDMKALGVRWISLSSHGRLASLHATRIEFPDPGPYRLNEAELVAAIRAATRHGFSVFLNPHLWIDEEHWRGEIRHETEEDWQAWFRSYRAFIFHQANLAARERVAMFSVGLELLGTMDRERDWRDLIAEVRSIYPGSLTYSANWWREVDAVPFWDALDLIGLQFFYPLAPSPEATDADLLAGLAAIREDLEGLSTRVSRPYVFTEVGYKASAAPWVEPWVWRSEGPEDEVAQARCYRSLVRAFHDAPNFSGLFLWNWLLRPGEVRPEDRPFSPQGRQAEEVVLRAFDAGSAAAAGSPEDER